MQIEYIIAGCLIAFGFFMPFLAYRKGIKDGYELANGKVPEPIKTPIKVVKDFVKDKEKQKEVDKVVEGWNNIMNYDGTPQGGEE